MYKEKIVDKGYIKLLALDVDHLETSIIMEKNTNYKDEFEEFKEFYGHRKNIVIFVLHIDYDNGDIKFIDYQRIRKHIHPFDYVKDLVVNKNAMMLYRTDIVNEKLWDQSKVTYIQSK